MSTANEPSTTTTLRGATDPVERLDRLRATRRLITEDAAVASRRLSRADRELSKAIRTERRARERAATLVGQAEARHAATAQDYETQVGGAVGAGVALLALTMLPLAWEQWRRSRAARRFQRAEPPGACLALAVAVGAALLVAFLLVGVGGEAAGVVAGAIGTAACGLGIAALAVRLQGSPQMHAGRPSEPGLDSLTRGRRMVVFGLFALALIVPASQVGAAAPEGPRFAPRTAKMASLVAFPPEDTPTREIRRLARAAHPLQVRAARLASRRRDLTERIAALRASGGH